MDRKTVVIKKYENRRLYDTANSRYVNLEDVAEMVRDGLDVQVVDVATGEDITRLVLTQIIVDSAKAPGSVFPLDMLRQMVVASGRASQESMLRYMKSMFDMYQGAYRSFAQPMNPFDFMQMMGGVRPREAPQQTPPAQPDQEVENLKRRIGELEDIISRFGETRAQPGGTRAQPRKKPAARRK